MSEVIKSQSVAQMTVHDPVTDEMRESAKEQLRMTLLQDNDYQKEVLKHLEQIRDFTKRQLKGNIAADITHEDVRKVNKRLADQMEKKLQSVLDFVEYKIDILESQLSNQ